MNERFSSICSALTLGLFVIVRLPVTAGADTLWRDDAPQSMFADKRAHAVGDILTILVQENNVTSKGTSTKSAKAAGVNASISSFLYPPSAGASIITKNGQLPAMQYNSKSDFDGGGTINNSEQITARIAVHVVDVLPNGNLVIEGSRQTAFSGENQTVVLRGTVRQEDITANNVIFSYNISEASIKFVSSGSISDSQRKGWFTKIWDKVSPF